MAKLEPGYVGFFMATRVSSGILIVFSLCSCVTGALAIWIVDYAGDLAKWPTQSGSGLWVGVVVRKYKVLP